MKPFGRFSFTDIHLFRDLFFFFSKGLLLFLVMCTCVNLCVGVYTYMLVPGEARRVYLGLEL